MLRRVLSRLRHLFAAARFRRELDEEMAFHLDALADDLVRQGVEPEEARRRARIRFGSVEHAHDRARQERGLATFDELARGLRLALRRMRRSPLFSTLFVVTLALCVGLGTSVFSVVDAVLWRPLPYPDADHLARVVRYDPSRGKSAAYTAVDGATWERIRDETDPLERAVYADFLRGVNLTTDRSALFVQQQRVGAGYFRTLGVPPERGREFAPDEDVPQGPAVAVLSHGLWTRAFDGDPDVLGGTIRLKGEPHTVVGIMPEGFGVESGVDVWTPLRPSTTGEGGGSNYRILARIPPTMSFEEADRRLGDIPTTESGGGPERRYGLVPLDQALSAGLRIPMTILLLAATLMLAVGCANLTGLQIARHLARRAENATRRALGGGASALARQVAVETLVFGVAGAAGGLALAFLGLPLVGDLLRSRLGIWHAVRLDGRAILAGLSLAAVATLGFAYVPVLQARRSTSYRALTSGARLVGGQGHLLRRILLVAQVATVTALLFGAGLLVRSYRHLDGLAPGFDPTGVLALQLSLDDARYAHAADVQALFDGTLEDIRGIPGVSSAAVALTLPYEQPLNLGVALPGADDPRITNAAYVTPGFFATLGVPVLQGRALDDRDRADGPVVAVANEAFVDTYLRDEPALGTTARADLVGDFTIVGVVGNVQQSSGWGGDEPVWESPTLYFASAQMPDAFFQLVHVWFSPSWIVRGAGDLTGAVTRALARAAPDLAVARTTTLAGVMDDAFAWERLEAAFLISVSVFALLLASVGLYGIVAHEVQERRGEIGLRVALGASPGGAVWTAAGRGIRLTLLGLGAGSAAGLALARGLLAPLIYGVAPYDPATLAAVLLALLAVAATASLIPAVRVVRIDPAEVLKEA